MGLNGLKNNNHHDYMKIISNGNKCKYIDDSNNDFNTMY